MAAQRHPARGSWRFAGLGLVALAGVPPFVAFVVALAGARRLRPLHALTSALLAEVVAGALVWRVAPGLSPDGRATTGIALVTLATVAGWAIGQLSRLPAPTLGPSVAATE